MNHNTVHIATRRAFVSASLITTIGIAVVFAFALVFVKFANEVTEQEFYAIDKLVSLAIHNTTTPMLTTIMLVVTGFGTIYLTIIALVSTLVGFGVAYRDLMAGGRERLRAIITILAPAFSLLGGVLLAIAVKYIVYRPRPNGIFFPPLEHPTDPSFPSGHTMSAISFYGMLAFIIGRHASWPVRIVLACVALTLVVIVGYSRMYLGAHFPTDVFGSALLGITWLVSGIISYSWAMRHLRLSPEEE